MEQNKKKVVIHLETDEEDTLKGTFDGSAEQLFQILTFVLADLTIKTKFDISKVQTALVGKYNELKGETLER